MAVYVKKLKLGFDELLALGKDGTCKCKAKEDAYVGSIYELSGYQGKYVMVTKSEKGVMELRWHEGKVLSATRGGELRKVSVTSRRDEGAFIGGASKFKVGEEVAVAEDYFNLCLRVGRGYMKDIAKAHGIEEVNKVKALPGWYNKKYVCAEVMPRRVEVLSAEVLRVSEISEELWHLLGVDWVNKDMELDRKKRLVGTNAWVKDSEVIVYRYKTLKGSVQTEADLKTYKEKCPWMFEKGE